MVGVMKKEHIELIFDVLHGSEDSDGENNKQDIKILKGAYCRTTQ
jgi:hypothetical protein